MLQTRVRRAVLWLLWAAATQAQVTFTKFPVPADPS